MGEAKWTNEQSSAINTRNCNLLVAAGAGAGKTAVLVERIIRRIMDEKEPVDIDRLLVVTFTNAAAAEMRERIGDAISKKLDENPDSRRLQKQLVLLSKANIMTIHSFCLQVIRNNFHTIDLDPNFRIADETEGVLLKQEVLEDLFEDMYLEENRTDDFIELVDSFGGKDDRKVQNMVLNLYRFSESSPWPEKWLNQMCEAFNVDENFEFQNTQWASILMNDVKTEAEGYRNRLQNAVSIVENAANIEYYLDPLRKDLENVASILRASDWNELVEGFDNLKFESLPVKRNKDADKEAKEAAKKIRDDVKKRLLSLKDGIFSGAADIPYELSAMYPKMKCLSQLVMEFAGRFKERKREKNLLDFSDIEHFCLEILIKTDEQGNVMPSPTAIEHREKFEEVLIDEYQDSNMVQEVIMNMISRQPMEESQLDENVQYDRKIPNMFMVGDVKQSIYKFRQAKPELFLHKYGTYSEQEGAVERKIKLFKNFRSRKEVIDGVNYLFKQIMSTKVGELEYDDGEALIASADYKECDEESEGACGGPIEVHMIEKTSKGPAAEISEESIEDDEATGSEDAPDNIQLEARLVAKRIRQIVNGEDEKPFLIFDKGAGAYRKVQYRDVVILMRATSEWAPTFMEELMNAGIPVFADTNSGYFETLEVKTMLSLLQIIDNPHQDIPLIAVLRSPIASFTPEDLIDIRLVNGDIGYFDAMKMISSEEPEQDSDVASSHVSSELKEKVKSFIARLNKWRETARFTPTDELIWHLYMETGYYGYCGAMPGGTQRQANLRMLFQKAKQFENTSYKGLFNFVNFIERLRISSGDMGSAKILGENENVVRIMSIHKSKGLEFPVVFLSGCGKNFNMMDVNQSILFHQELGFGPDFVDAKRRITYPTVVKSILKKKIKIETLSEEMRILYVAFTRAREKLIITGMMNKIEDKAKDWCREALSREEKVPAYAVMNAKCYMEWICLALARHASGDIIRKKGGELETSQVIFDESKWCVRLWNREDFLASSNEEHEETSVEKYVDNALENMSSDEEYEKVAERLSWKYDYSAASMIPAKLSVSELKRQFNMVESEDSQQLLSSFKLQKPRFLEKTRKFTAAERGTIMHLVMQHFDLNRVSSREEIKQQVNEFVVRELLTEEQASTVNMNKVLEFFKSPLGVRMCNSKDVKKEKTFYIYLPCTEIYPELPKDRYHQEKVLVQGVMDCYFQEDDGMVLLDYKTDYVDDVSEIKEKYRIQLEYYEKALEKITGKKVKEKYLYLFHNGEIVKY